MCPFFMLFCVFWWVATQWFNSCVFWRKPACKSQWGKCCISCDSKDKLSGLLSVSVWPVKKPIKNMMLIEIKCSQQSILFHVGWGGHSLSNTDRTFYRFRYCFCRHSNILWSKSYKLKAIMCCFSSKCCLFCRETGQSRETVIYHLRVILTGRH